VRAIAVEVAPAELLVNVVLMLDKGNYTKLGDRHGKTIAMVRGANYDDAFMADAAIKKYEVEDYVMGVKMAHAARVDGVVGPQIALYYQMKMLGIKREEFAPPLVLNARMSTFFIAKQKADPALVAQLKKGIDAFRDSGAFEAIVDKYTK
jgi:ABC-type amino acid transport substrate-binding protein